MDTDLAGLAGARSSSFFFRVSLLTVTVVLVLRLLSGDRKNKVKVAQTVSTG
jgi:hypothetical protein